MELVEDDRDINELRNELEEQYSKHGNLCDLGSSLIAMCEYDKAERYYRMLLEYLPEDHSSIGYINGSLGIIFANRGDYQTALKFWTTDDRLGQHNDDLGITYVHIGAAYRHLGQRDLALKCCSMAADMQSPTGSLALEYFLKALQIDEQVLKLRKYHPKLANAYNNIGEIDSHLGDDENALKYLEHALEIRLKGTVTTHTDLAAIYHNLGCIYARKKELKKALELHEKALEIDTKALNPDHESLAGSHGQIASIFFMIRDFSKAVYHGEQSLRITLRSQAKDNHLSILQCQYNLGRAQFELGDTTKALNMAEKALNNLSSCSSDNQEAAALTYDLFSLVYEKEGDITKALEYSQKAVEQAKIWAMRNRTFELEYFLYQLETLHNSSCSKENQFSTSIAAQNVWWDNIADKGSVILQTNEELERTPEINIEQRLLLLNKLIGLCSRQKDFSRAMKYFDEANALITQHQATDVMTKEQLENVMMHIFYAAARVYHRQMDWNMCLNMLAKPLKLALQQNEILPILPKIYYCIASCHAHRQDIPMAIYYYELAISTARKILPDDHPDIQLYCFQSQMYKKKPIRSVF